MNIRLDLVHYTYPGGTHALNAISLIIPSGERVALVGENGSGKSTLARHLNGLLRPQSGQVHIEDWRTDQHTPAELSRRVAYVFQNPDEQLFCQRIWDEISFGPKNLGYDTSQVKSMVDDAIQLVNLHGDVYQNPRDLGYSGRKKVALASALAMQTPILILDEPTAGLDDGEQTQLKQVIATVHKQGKTVLMISHDLDFIAENFDRVIQLHQGRLYQDKTTRQFIAHNAQANEHIMPNPQITRLSQALGHQQLARTIEEFIANQQANQKPLNTSL